MIERVEKVPLRAEPVAVDMAALRQMFHNNNALVRKFGLKFIEVANDTLAEMKEASLKKI